MAPLKLKGDKAKKKKKSSSSTKLHDEDDLQGHQVASGSTGRTREGSGTPVKTIEDNQAEMDEGKTEAEKRFFAVQRKRLAEKAAKGAKLSHKDRVAQFNEKLESLSEHHDIPKVCQNAAQAVLSAYRSVSGWAWIIAARQVSIYGRFAGFGSYGFLALYHCCYSHVPFDAPVIRTFCSISNIFSPLSPKQKACTSSTDGTIAV